MGPVPHGNLKTILIVDDDPGILVVVSAILDGSEYSIMTARNGSNALEQSRAFKGDIHLLLSDFEMPGMSGIELATLMTIARPDLKVLLMSGFAGGMLILNEGWHFLTKPFLTSQLQALVAGLVFPDRKSPRFSKSPVSRPLLPS
jgi:two-component system cell cycle sensor histidine kinase/response regulator CckA